MLAPVIGIVQVGGQARADRYTYLPQIGLYLLLTWAAADLCAGWRQRRVVLGGGAAIVLLALIGCARKQVSYWRNSEALWTHTLACTSDNALAHTNLGLALFQKESVDEAMVQYQEALQINPDDVLAHNDLGNALLKKGHVDKAMVQYQEALRINPDFALAHNNLGLALFKKGDVDEAMVQYQKALQINPDYALARNNLGFALFQKGRVDEAIVQYQEALKINPHINLHIAQVHDNLGNALFKRGDVDEAIAQFQKALQIDPDNEGAHSHLGSALLIKGNVAEAIAQYQKALQINPQYVETLNNLAWVLATCPQASLRNGHQAVELAQRANQLAGDGHLALLGTLAAAYAEAGRFPEAVSTAQRALQVAQTQTNTARADALRSQLKLYQAGKPIP
jgi:tetratricopeptide (TPR) repeat protein